MLPKIIENIYEVVYRCSLQNSRLFLEYPSNIMEKHRGGVLKKQQTNVPIPIGAIWVEGHWPYVSSIQYTWQPSVLLQYNGNNREDRSFLYNVTSITRGIGYSSIQRANRCYVGIGSLANRLVSGIYQYLVAQSLHRIEITQRQVFSMDPSNIM